MTDTTDLVGIDFPEVMDRLRDFQQIVFAGNDANGFHDEFNEIQAGIDTKGWPDFILRNYHIVKAALISGEANEAIEEFRHNRSVNEGYFSDNGEGYFSDFVRSDGSLRKPEGVPAEIADVVIRCFDYAEEGGFDLAEWIEMKLAYNATRGHKHGGKSV